MEEILQRGGARLEKRTSIPSRADVSFPESDNAFSQLRLMMVGSAPVAADLGGQTLRGLGGAVALAGKKIANYRVKPYAFLIAAAVIFSGAMFSQSHTLATEVRINGESVGVVANAQTYLDAKDFVTASASTALGYDFSFEDEGQKITSVPVIVSKDSLLDQEALEDAICNASSLVTYSYVLNVDGKAVGATGHPEILETLLKQKLNQYVTADTISAEFVQNIEISHEVISADEKSALGSILDVANSTSKAKQVYTIKDGDTWSEIAEAYEMSSADLLALNPGSNIDMIHIGQQLTVSAEIPLLSVKTINHESYVAAVPYDIEKQNDSSMYVGQTKVLTAGVNGTADVVANVSYVNGVESQRDIVSSVTTTAPITEVLAVGTKARPATMASGSFRWPASGRLSSTYGYRTVLGVYRFHSGIDIAGYYGAPIYAADGGTVTYAGWMSGYGYLVIISHGNGYQTYYGHNSKLLVSVGTKVYKGQNIAKMGSTGRSTGNHCHFEIRYNGSTVNPLKYLP
ncbi:MAG: peptidoglycan DD-metalloendopeptidase family protein [Oscillospiraceae bacterium]|nr:peptidoglycan DD-metalloendopeptidase family protein [Oscillospiraceae bacterium]